MDEASFPRDLANVARFNHALRQIEPRRNPPPPLTFDELDAFLATAGRYDGVSWSGQIEPDAGQPTSRDKR